MHIYLYKYVFIYGAGDRPATIPGLAVASRAPPLAGFGVPALEREVGGGRELGGGWLERAGRALHRTCDLTLKIIIL